jgi:hypothetical protein
VYLTPPGSEEGFTVTLILKKAVERDMAYPGRCVVNPQSLRVLSASVVNHPRDSQNPGFFTTRSPHRRKRFRHSGVSTSEKLKEVNARRSNEYMDVTWRVVGYRL